MTSSPQRAIGSSAALAQALEQASALANINRPVLVLGERGTGKELIAERLHYLSPRWDQAFVSLNCATISEDLMESELFGHEPGAFTGAQKIHHGRFERADGGSLFLDELGAMSTRLQEKLLRVIEYGEFERLGGHKTLKVDVRLIAATNADLKNMAAKGEFRADLLDRLAFDVIPTPPLRERKEDIEELADYFAMRMSIELGWESFAGFSDKAMEALKQHAWPGNIRELKNCIERSVFRQGETNEPLENIIIDPFPHSANTEEKVAEKTDKQPAIDTQHTELVKTSNQQIDFKQRLNQLEKALLIQALEQNQQSQKQAAKALSLSYDQIRGLMKKHLK
ncbi:phage shock protein [Marinomonas sp. S3726]|uniref:phage shock protein operon transcriptional activator n=1 Tax=Marinomonas sp. S3726 TaxID=579484 RepID=UPI0005F9F12B|nr:phage shock protein operon transcriptional activator [Marinomonas sp. S3726]KJZ14212.1 phage shock protein [Marinomonas sp. S3726]